MSSRLISIAKWMILLAAYAAASRAQAAQWTLVGWNNLGMHCMDDDFAIFSLLPPYNTIHAQLIDTQGKLVRNPAALGITVTYQGVADPDGSINLTSAGKTNFWDHVGDLFGASLPVNAGLAGKNMPGASNAPQAMTYDSASAWFIAEGIPITPYDDGGRKNYYPLMRLTARSAVGQVLATTDIVLPVSDEMSCKGCHGSGTQAQPPSGWVNDPDPVRDMRLNVLKLHDETEAGKSSYTTSLAQAGYNPAGLRATVESDGKAILCAACHLSEALPGSGKPDVPPLTQSIHGRHQFLDSIESGRNACYKCHPGSATKCLRGAMGAAVAADGTLAMQCQSCHGSMTDVAAPTRTGWLNEPSCQNCHSGTATRNSGQIRFLSAFDSSGNPRVPADRTFATTDGAPLPGLDLYRFSTGHGGLKCEACHGSTHAEFPSSHRNDNIQSVQHQGHVGMFAECTTCHGTQPNTVNGGPHGMHPVGSAWVSRHPDVVESSGASACQACHGKDYRGTVLSRSQADRMLSTEFGTKFFWRGFQVGCYTCHNGPSSESASLNRAAVAQNASATTATNASVTINLIAIDPDGNPLTLRIVSQPAHGSVGLVGRAATYFPDPGYAGVDSFTFAAWDGATDSNLATVTISVGGTALTATPTATVPTPRPTATPSRVATFTNTIVPTRAATGTPATGSTRTATARPTLTRSATPLPTATPPPSRTPTSARTYTPTTRPSATRSLTPTSTKTATPRPTATATPRQIRTATPTPARQGEDD